MEVSLFVLGAHLIGDFLLQTDRMASKKFENRNIRAKHVLLYHLPFLPLFLEISFPNFAIFLLGSLIIHFVIDSKRWMKGKGNIPYFGLIVDQSIHIYSLGILLILI